MILFQRLGSLLAKGVGLLANLLLLAMISAIAIQVAARFIFSAPTVWSEELARFLLVSITMVGSAVLIEKNEHITIDIFLDAVPSALRIWLKWLRDAITLTVCGLLVHYGWTLVGIGGRQTSTGLAVKMSVPYTAIPIGAALMALVLVLSRLGRIGKHEYED
jgi:TRAP-type C4-dicarboxylate transport system permease small subunit